MSETPHHISVEIDEILDGLNRKWDLRLPRLYGKQGRKAEKEEYDLALRCSGRIRFLCYRSVRVKLAIQDFEDQAKYIKSKWVYKPSQERGTLPSMPVTKSFIKRDIISEQKGNLTIEQRGQLLKTLATVLDEEYKLAQDSTMYERVTSPAPSAVASRNTSFTTAPSFNSESTELHSPQISPQKREISMTKPHKNKRQKVEREESARQLQRQTTLHDFRTANSSTTSFQSASSSAPRSQTLQRDTEPTPQHSQLRPAELLSFDTAPSPSPEDVFSPRRTQSVTSSANTSLTSTSNHESYPLSMSTQQMHEILHEPSFASMLDVNEQSPLTVSEYLYNKGPFRPSNHSLPTSLPFLYRYELYRLSLETDMLVRELHTTYERISRHTIPTYNDFWEATQRKLKTDGKIVPAKSNTNFWNPGDDIYTEAKSGRSLQFTGQLELNEYDNKLFKFTLNAVKVDKSCRFHRKFGSDRFMIVFLPFLTASQLPEKIRKRWNVAGNEIHDAVIKWLSTTELHIAGRIWRAFFFEPDKAQSKKRKIAEGSRQKLHLFAVRGPDFLARPAGNSQAQRHIDISIQDFTEMHMPLRANSRSTDLKLFSRFGLGLSKTTATIALEPREFIHVKDNMPATNNDEVVMNDGCALMSQQLAKAIWEMYGDGTASIPTAFQGRISGAKGLWVVDTQNTYPDFGPRGFWIEVSDSQLKIKPHPKTPTEAEDYQRTFEVLKTSHPCAPGHLNLQLINILVRNGVSRSAIANLLLEDIDAYVTEAKTSSQDGILLRAWLQEYHRVNRNEEIITFVGGIPNCMEEEVCMLVEGGFTTRDSSLMRKDIKKLMKFRLDDYVEKLKIKVPCSTSAFCVPDPYGVLEPDEVHLSFSTRFENPYTKLLESTLENIDVVIARNPAHLASDIQKRRAVYKYELRHFQDVIVFSTKGDIPLASLLSGGDYDGDTVTIMWDPRLTESFQNKDKPTLPSEEECDLVKKSRKLDTIFKDSKPTQAELDSFFATCMEFNAHFNYLGACTNAHETLIYCRPDLASVGAVKLAALAGYLVDSSKQGLYLSDDAWFRVKREVLRGPEFRRPSYKPRKPGKPGKPNEPPRRRNGVCINVIDFLKFDVAEKEKEKVLQAIEVLWPEDGAYDRALSQPYNQEVDRARNREESQRAAIAAVMDKLKKDVQAFRATWTSLAQGEVEDREKKSFFLVVRDAYEEFRGIIPADVDCDIVREFRREGQEKGSKWSVLRASCMHYCHWKSSFCWFMVLDELCRIKARSFGFTRELVPWIHNIYKADLRLIKSFGSTQAEEEEDDDDNDELGISFD